MNKSPSFPFILDPWIEELYEQFRSKPSLVSSDWQKFFQNLEKTFMSKEEQKEALIAPISFIEKGPKDSRIQYLIDAYRRYGHLEANFNPLEEETRKTSLLELTQLGFHEKEKKELFPTCGLLKEKEASLEKILQTLRKIYCSSIGYEYMDLHSKELEAYLQERIEKETMEEIISMDEKQEILQELNKSELLESFIHKKYPGQKRFSLEGGETLIPILKSLIEESSEEGIQEVVLGMAHRGRLNVLSNILQKSYSDIFAEFEEGYVPPSFEKGGDVKYHKGFEKEIETKKKKRIKIILSPNASHVESIFPILEGFSHAKIKEAQVLPILIHGDAALAGQGVVYETLQLSGLVPYHNKGTIHFALNNQIGFTTLPNEGRSTRYCTDIAKIFGAPIFHVNAEDPESCLYVTKLAQKIRQRFLCDVFIDLNCYRKYGHNESDEPFFTQPYSYKKIKQKKPIREIYRDKLIHEGVVEKYLAEGLEKEFKNALHEAMQRNVKTSGEKTLTFSSENEKEILFSKDTSVDRDSLKMIAKKLTSFPENFHLHTKLAHLMKEKEKAVKENLALDWALGELLAYGSLLIEGVSIRLSGQDSRRGTFSHRHAVFLDQETEEEYTPLKFLQKDQGSFTVINTPLSEYAALGFEYGYSVASKNTLVLWEAQYGDFSNGAQIIFDQYISAGEEKWGQKSSLVVLLPHGYEGQGPEHSSARIERFLNLAGNHNMFVVNPTTPSQFFHLIRRQAYLLEKKPLVVFTPKSLLRHPLCTSSLIDFSEGHFQSVILEEKDKLEKAEKIVFCSGHIYFDLVQEKEKRKASFLLIRIEQLYPFPKEEVLKILESAKKCRQVLFVQEEPENMGPFSYMIQKMQSLIPEKISFDAIARPVSASPATGSSAKHKVEQEEIFDEIFSDSKGNENFSFIHHLKA